MIRTHEGLQSSIEEREHPVTRLDFIDGLEAASPYQGNYPAMTPEDVFGLTTYVKAGARVVTGDGGIMDEARWTVEVRNYEYMKVLQEE